jgi:hypothetical protein
MTDHDPILKINFVISPVARVSIEALRQKYEKDYNVKTCAAVVMWGEFKLNDGREFQDVIVTFYEDHQYESIRHGIQMVDGLAVVFFTTPEYSKNFDGKVLDAKDGRFLLR